MSAPEVIDDLVELELLAAQERDATRRQRLMRVHDRLAARSEGAKVSDAAAVLGLSTPTVRAWIEAGVLEPVPTTSPTRVTYSSLATPIRGVVVGGAQRDEPQLLSYVSRVLRDRVTLDDVSLSEAVEDVREGRTKPVKPSDLGKLIPGSRPKKRPSKSP
jgi:hypothetical protein